MLRPPLGLSATVLLAGIAAASGPRPDDSTPVKVDPENVLVIVLDDIGVDLIRSYATGNPSFDPNNAPNTIRIDQLAAEGVRFDRAWAHPYCSPARSAALTGLYPNQTGLGHYAPAFNSGCVGLNVDYSTIGDLLPAPYSAGAVGKWHLANESANGSQYGGLDHAPRMGFQFLTGTRGNFTMQQMQDYFTWTQLVAATVPDPNGGTMIITNEFPGPGYATTRTTEDAIRALNYFGDDPFFLWVAYHSVHAPLHTPPDLAGPGSGYEYMGQIDDATASDLEKGKAMIEALDFEIGRLLDAMDPDVAAKTTVVVFGDNGTQSKLIQAPFDSDEGKSTVFRGGVHVPFIVTGARVAQSAEGSSCEALIDLTDLLPTVGAITGFGLPSQGETLMGKSLLPYLQNPSLPSERQWIYAERFKRNYDGFGAGNMVDPNNLWQRTIRNERYKLMRVFGVPSNNDFCGNPGDLSAGLQTLFFDLEGDVTTPGDPFEDVELIDFYGGTPADLPADVKAIFDELSDWMDDLEAGINPTP